MRKTIGATLLATLLSLAGTSKADMIFSPSGVWSEPRIYDGSSVATEPLELDKPYSIKTRIENTNTTTPITAYLTAEITGPQTFQFDYGSITLNPDATSIRTRTLSEGFTLPGDYTITMNLDNGQSIERDFNVVPEPSGLALLIAGVATLNKKRKRQ